jgi:hypothetical protein
VARGPGRRPCTRGAGEEADMRVRTGQRDSGWTPGSACSYAAGVRRTPLVSSGSFGVLPLYALQVQCASLGPWGPGRLGAGLVSARVSPPRFTHPQPSLGLSVLYQSEQEFAPCSRRTLAPSRGPVLRLTHEAATRRRRLVGCPSPPPPPSNPTRGSTF